LQRQLNGLLKCLEHKRTKHLVFLTDAMPTKGDNPEQKTLNAVSMARDAEITISIIGINLTDDGLKLAKKIIEISNGKLHKARSLEAVDSIF